MSMSDLAKISEKANPNFPALMSISLMQKLRNLIEQERLATLLVKLRCASIDRTTWHLFVQFRRELSLNEAHSYAFLLQHEDFNVSQKEGRPKLKDIRAHGYYSDRLI